MARFCNQCNSPIEEGGNFCTECGSNDIRDDSPVSEPITEPIPEAISQEENIEEETVANEPIPELDVDSVISFGDRSIENMQKADIKSISEPKTNIYNVDNDTTPPNEIQTTPISETKEANEPSTSSFADIPDFMNGAKVIEPPTTPVRKIPSNKIAHTNNSNITNNDKKKNTITIAIVIAAIVITLIVVVAILYSYSKGTTNEGAFQIDGEIETFIDPRSDDDYSEIFTSENSYRVGDRNVGYVSIPQNWTQIRNDNTGLLQYTDNDSSWIITLMSIPTSQYSAISYANSVYSSIETGGGQNIKAQKSKIAGYDALSVRAIYPHLDKYLTTWCFESKAGKTHYLAIEGPEEDSDYYRIIYSFNENK